MTKAFLSAVAFALLSGISFGAYANPAPAAAEPAPAAVAAVAAVNINTADADTLVRELKGIGAAKAKAIIEYREANGPFTSVDDLLEVKGIGTATLEKNRAKIGVN
jgi:competence protein ComEA